MPDGFRGTPLRGDPYPTAPVPLSPRELDRVYLYQVYLKAIKACEMCSLWLTMDDFFGWGEQPCYECRQQQRRARGAGWHSNL